MKRIINWAIKNHVAIMFTLSIILIASVISYFTLPKNVFPKGEFPRFQVIADLGFASLEETELKVTRPLEKALRTVPGVVEVRSVTERGTSTIDIYLKWGINLKQAFQLVQTKISEVRSVLPTATSVEALQMTTSAYPVSEYGIWSDKLNLKQLHSFVKYSVIPQLIGIDGIYGIDISGGKEPEIWIKLDPKKMAKYNIDPDVVANAVNKANQFDFIGNVVQKNILFMAFGGNQLSNINKIKNIVIDTRMGYPIYLKDIANIDNSHKPIRTIVSVNGHKGLFLDIRKQQNADGIKLSKRLDQKLKEIQKNFNGKLHISKWDLSDFVQGSIQGILFDLFLGILLILLIVYYVLNKFRISLPIILILPMVVIFEFLVLKLLGLTINIMTLGGLSAAIGIVADNSIVMTENYIKFKELGKSKNPIVDSAIEIGPLMLWATLVTIIVFIPLNTLSGVSGLFFRPLSITLSTTIIISLIMALFVTPVFINYFIHQQNNLVLEHKEKKILSIIRKGYIKLLNFSLDKKKIIFITLGVLLIVSSILFIKLPSGFLPEWDEGDIVFDYITPAGYSIFATDKLLTNVEKEIQKYPEIKMYIRKTGTHLGTPIAPPNWGEIVLILKKKRKKSTFKMIDEIQNDISKKFPQLDTDFHQILPDRLGDLTGSTKPIVVNILGNDLTEINKVAQDIKNKMKKIKGLNSVMIDMPPLQKEIKIDVKRQASSVLGLTVADVSKYAKTALYGDQISSSPNGLKIIPIREIFAGNFYNNINALSNLPIYTPNGGLVPLKKMAKINVVMGMSENHHLNGVIVESVTAEISGRSLSGVVNDIKHTLANIKNSKVGISLAGDYKNQQTSFRELLIVLGISIILILMIILFIFESYKTAFAVFLGTVLSVTFVIFGLFITRTEFDVSSFIGLITVMGIVVNNGILVIEFVERFRRAGVPLREALISAGNLRFRPVLITNLAAIAGFLPMALNIGHGGEVLYPFSIAMISGLIGSMMFSLIVMPTLYGAFHMKRKN